MRSSLGILGAGLVGAGAAVVVLCYVIPIPNARLLVGVGGLLAGLSLLLVILATSERQQLSEVRAGMTESGANAERYAELLAKLEQLRIQRKLPENVYTKLEKEYVQRLKTELEARYALRSPKSSDDT